MFVRRSLLQLCRRPQRSLSTQPATSAEVPDDPDILTTQDPADNPTDESPETHILSQDSSGAAIDLTQKYPRLQYRPPALGVVPAFDLALNLIKKNRIENEGKLQTTRRKIEKIEALPEYPTLSKEVSRQLTSLKRHERWLEGVLDIHDPEIRWRAARGDVDLNMPIYRDLAQRKWQARQYHLIMERVTQMYVVPDVLNSIQPTADVRLSFPARTSGQRQGKFEVGELLHSTETTLKPKIEVQSFADTGARYSIAIIDPDVPDESKDSFKSYLHYLHTDISLTPQEHAVEDSNGTIRFDYIPPHPQKGTPYHRYTVIVFEQPATPRKDFIFPTSREEFSARAYAQQNGMHATGISYWRQVWDDNVANVMANHPEANYVEKNYKRIKA